MFNTSIRIPLQWWEEYLCEVRQLRNKRFWWMINLYHMPADLHLQALTAVREFQWQHASLLTASNELKPSGVRPGLNKLSHCWATIGCKIWPRGRSRRRWMGRNGTERLTWSWISTDRCNEVQDTRTISFSFAIFLQHPHQLPSSAVLILFQQLWKHLWAAGMLWWRQPTDRHAVCYCV